MTPPDQNTRPSVAQLILEGGTPKRAFFTALVVGTILTAINHGDVFLDGSMPPIWKIVLTYCVPYCVTTWGAVTGKLAEWRRLTGGSKFETQSLKS